MVRRIVLFALAASALACSREPAADPVDRARPAATFRFVHTTHDERFVARTSDPDLIAKARAELAKPLAERSLHINGVIAKGSDANAPWTWHFVEKEWTLAEMSIELCDAWPGYIEENLDTWLADVGFFCPWASRVEMELQ